MPRGPGVLPPPQGPRSRAPGVTSVGMRRSCPEPGQPQRSRSSPKAFSSRPAPRATVLSARIDEGYRHHGIPLVAGRGFRTSDTADTPRVAIVNQPIADRYWPGQSHRQASSARSAARGNWVEVVGVTADSAYNLIVEGPRCGSIPAAQDPVSRRSLVVASRAKPPHSPRRSARSSGTSTRMPISGVRTMEEFYYGNATVKVHTLRDSHRHDRAARPASLVGRPLRAGRVLVARRTREIGIRIAVGARSPSSVLRMVLRHGLVLSAARVSCSA